MTGRSFSAPVRDVRVRYHRPGGDGAYAHLLADFEPPSGPGGEPEFVNELSPFRLPPGHAEAVWRGVREGLGGHRALVRLRTGTLHLADSAEHGYREAGRLAARGALIAAGLGEPEPPSGAEAESGAVPDGELPGVTWPGRRGLPLPAAVRGLTVRVLYNRGGCGPFAIVTADLEPPGPEGGPELLSEVPEDRLPAEYLPALRAGLADGLCGVAARVRITDGRFHEVDSSELAYELAGRAAGLGALAATGLLPDAAVGDSRRLRVTWPGRRS
ncbi:hypothetical protein [Streptomyces sp. NPDC051211]|uniref:hypothetical protein n=1 Tax=Streptomyces sp. NPDC051211 TaxID=3154643 RepID=UPI00344B8031